MVSGGRVHRPAEGAEAAPRTDLDRFGSGDAARPRVAAGLRCGTVGVIVGPVKAAIGGAGALLAVLRAVVALASGAVGVQVAPDLLALRDQRRRDRHRRRQADQCQYHDLRPLLRVHQSHPAMQAAVKIPSASDSPARNMASAVLPSSIACGRCGNAAPDTRNPPICTTSAMTPHTTISTSPALCAMTLASGIAKPSKPPTSAIAAATLPPRISAISRCGVRRA